MCGLEVAHASLSDLLYLSVLASAKGVKGHQSRNLIMPEGQRSWEAVETSKVLDCSVPSAVSPPHCEY